MNHNILVLAGVLVPSTYLCSFLYRRIWHSVSRVERTPTGFGVFLAIELCIGTFVASPFLTFISAFLFLLAATAIYWVDDVMELSARVRVLISALTGAILCACLLAGADLHWTAAAAMIFGAAITNLVLTNMVNFYDGADLNLATLIGLTALMMLGFDPPDPELSALAMTCVAFIVPFGIVNSRPRSLYLGDAGAFAFAGLITVLLIVYITSGKVAPEVAIPLALPALDTSYVLLIRIKEGHDLLTRNYLHLYQRLERHQPRFVYLIPQAVNIVLVLTCAWLLQRAAVPHLLAVLLAAAVVTPIFYFSCRRLLLPPSNAEARGDARACDV